MPASLPPARVTHRFKDTFALIGSAQNLEGFETGTRKARQTWAARQNWLLIDESSNTGRRLRSWMRTQGLDVDPGMLLDSFDLIINLVALGMGVSFVPIRALRLYGRKRAIVRLPWKDRFTRELVVVMRRNRIMPTHLERFIDNVLF